MASARAVKSSFPHFIQSPRRLQILSISESVNCPVNNRFPQAGRLISFQESKSRWSEIPSKLRKPVLKGHYVSTAVLHPSPLEALSAACTVIYFQAVRPSPRPDVVSAVCFLFWWRGSQASAKSRMFIPTFCSGQAMEPRNGRCLSLLFEIQGLLLSLESPALESFTLRRNNLVKLPRKMPRTPPLKMSKALPAQAPSLPPLQSARAG